MKKDEEEEERERERESDGLERKEKRGERM